MPGASPSEGDGGAIPHWPIPSISWGRSSVIPIAATKTGDLLFVGTVFTVIAAVVAIR